MIDEKHLPKAVTVAELLSRKGWLLGRSATYEAIRNGEIPHFVLRGKKYIPLEALERLLAGETGNGSSSTE